MPDELATDLTCDPNNQPDDYLSPEPVIEEQAEFELRSAVNWAAMLLGDGLARQIVEDELRKVAREFIDSQFRVVGPEVPF